MVSLKVLRIHWRYVGNGGRGDGGEGNNETKKAGELMRERPDGRRKWLNTAQSKKQLNRHRNDGWKHIKTAPRISVTNFLLSFGPRISFPRRSTLTVSTLTKNLPLFPLSLSFKQNKMCRSTTNERCRESGHTIFSRGRRRNRRTLTLSEAHTFKKRAGHNEDKSETQVKRNLAVVQMH